MMNRYAPAAMLPLILGAHAALCQEACGGTERWSVKVATDDGAGSIDTKHIQDASVVVLNDIERPADAGRAGDTRLDPEKVVYRIKGFLRWVRTKEPDHDYHIVIADTADAPYANSSTAEPTGQSMVAESPNKDCLSGEHGDDPTNSRFVDRFGAVRDSLDCNLRASNSLDHMISVPVTITGVLFFDFPHHQLGRAKNVAELHPIVGIEFDDVASGCSNAPFNPS